MTFFNLKALEYKKMTRLKIVGIHFLISLTLVSSSVLSVIYFWYPDIYAQTENFFTLLMILAAVDVSLGPLLTAIVFQPNKKSLKFDLSVIGLLQIAALIYGITTLFIARPVYIVFNVDRLTVVTAVEIPEQELKKAAQNYQTFSYTGPILVGSRLPTNAKDSNRLLELSIYSHIDLPQLPQNYVPYEEMTYEIQQKLQSLETLLKRKPKSQTIIESALLELNISMKDVGFLPVVAKTRDAIAIIDRKNAKILKYLPVDAW